MTAPVLLINDLCVEFEGADGPVRVVDGLSVQVGEGEVLGLVGESGSGKSVTLLAVLGLLPAGAKISGGEIWLNSRRVDDASDDEMRLLRGGAVSMIFQDPMTSLNPVLRIGKQIAEAIRLHAPGTSKEELHRRVVELLEMVGVPNPEARIRQFPHEFSGGMRQRAMIAMAIANSPALLMADEPTTALDVTIQAQVMDVLEDVRRKNGASMILVTHDLGLVAETANRIAVMYSGRLVETANVDTLFSDPAHPYTIGLLESLPSIDDVDDQLRSIQGQPPDPASRPEGCAFYPRCSLGQGRSICETTVPRLKVIGPGHMSACHFAEEAVGTGRGRVQ